MLLVRTSLKFAREESVRCFQSGGDSILHHSVAPNNFVGDLSGMDEVTNTIIPPLTYTISILI